MRPTHSDRRLPPAKLIPTILGPTAVGKSRVAFEVARRTGREIIVADSRQVYRRLEIATNKPLKQDRAVVRYHCIDLADAGGTYNVHHWVEAATQVLEQVPRLLIEGGTNLYVDALLDGMSLSKVAPRPERRRELERLTTEEMAEMARVLDPGLKIDFRNRVRLVRAIEVLEVAGPPLDRLRTRSGARWPALRIGLTMPLAELEERIRVRCQAQLERGLIDETRAALEAGVDPSSQALSGTGYAETVAFLQGRITRLQLPELMVLNNRRLAKRQLTWLRRDGRIRWFPAEPDPVPAILNYLEEPSA